MVHGLCLALGLSLLRVVVEVDDLVLVQLLRGDDTQTQILVALQEEIHALLYCFSVCDMWHMYREGN
jgi:hypothetical protein